MPDVFIGQVLAHHINAFDGVTAYENASFPPTLDVFETAVVSVLSDVDEYVREQHSTVIDINEEAKFIHRISDIRSELIMIQDVLDQQKKVLTLFLEDPTRDTDTAEYINEYKWAPICEARSKIEDQFNRTKKIDRDADRIEKVIQDKLNLTRTAASMNAANASIAEARQSKLLSVVVLSFTIITIIFTPISFLATLFALDIDTFSGVKYNPSVSGNVDGTSDMYSGGKMAGIFVGVEILTLILTIVLTIGTGYILLYNIDKLSEWADSVIAKRKAGVKIGKAKPPVGEA
ncbi:hypothetical protein F4821DRAFT_241298 [Hypoxylon rubiginosum]|uniref:Uncharacterized protein n=1 Tax=Hypoxylon rubiginosum TaxID=110542 RepID=A0ACC0CXI2_9PEZI|nr:hypothetical protein F4821DRAFT_241298 [Hypoxylon rubiginosum]